MSKAMNPFSFFAILALVAVLLVGAACFGFPLQPPMARYTISSGVGYRLKPLGGGGQALHRGVDLVGPAGSAILAAGSGVVVEHWPAPGTPIPGRPGKTFGGHPVMGGYIAIDHGGGIITLYGHMSRTYVHTGQRVGAGQIIGRQGATGDATGDHLHFELVVDPCLFFAQPLGPALRDPRELLR
jgi:murein DD-endopeptidase MepM/ murein hydrolase activator NlpD